jgi:sulfopyruvate decarboxylase subunit beta
MPASGSRMPLDTALDVLARRRGEAVVVATMTALAPWRARAGSDRDLICLGFMGGASTLGLGVALAQPETPVWVLDGDGSLEMQLGSLITIANAAPRRFVHVVLNNGVYDTSGAQPVPGEGTVSFAALAEAAGYAQAVRFSDIESFDAAIDGILEADGPVLVELMTQPTGIGYQIPEFAQAPRRHPFAANWRAVRDAILK